MERISDLLSAGPTLSFEFFPPKTDDAQHQLVQTLRDLESLNPSFVSVTYGAGGSTRHRTHDLVVGIANTTFLTPMAHLSCVAHSRDELQEIIGRYQESGIKNVLALGGDAPLDGGVKGVFTHAIELVQFLKEEGDFSIGVAVHPEGHPKADSFADDRVRVSEKLAMADFGITQFFFDADVYTKFLEDIAAHGVTKPIIPGIMPVTNLSQVTRMAQLSGSAVPEWLVDRLDGLDKDDAVKAGIDAATKLCADLIAVGAPGLHFYTLNRSTATRIIATNLGLGVRSGA